MRRKLSLSVRRRVRSLAPLRTKKSYRPLVSKKLRKLEKIVPGCRYSGLETLLRRTAEYIFILEMQVNALKSLSNLYDQNEVEEEGEALSKTTLLGLQYARSSLR